MSQNTYSNSRLFLGNKEILDFDNVSYKNSGKNSVSTFNVKMSDPSLDDFSLLGQEVVFYLNYGSTDSVPFFRGWVKQYTPSDKALKIVAHDALSFLAGAESPPLVITSENNYDGFTIGQMLYDYISNNVNKNVTKAKLIDAWSDDLDGSNYGGEYEPIRVSADGAYIAAIAGQGSSSRIHVYATQTGQISFDGQQTIVPLWTANLPASAFSVDISDDGEYIVCGSGPDVYLFDKDSSTAAWIYDESSGGDDKKSCAISGDGTYVVSGEFSGRHVHLWTRANGNAPTWSYNTTKQIEDIDISNDGSVIVARNDDTLHVWNDPASIVAATYETTSMTATGAGTPGTVNIDGTTVTINASQTAAQVAALIAAPSYTNYTAAVTNTDRVTFTQKIAGTVGNVALTMSDAVYAPVAATFETTDLAPTDGNHYINASVTIHGISIAVGAHQTGAQIASTIAANFPDAVNGLDYTAVASAGGTGDNRVTFTQKVAGTAGNVAIKMTDATYRPAGGGTHTIAKQGGGTDFAGGTDHTIAKQGGGTDFAGGASAPDWTKDKSSDKMQASAVSEDGNYIVIGTNDNKVELYSKSSSTPLWTSATLGIHTDSGRIDKVAISSDGSQIVAVGDRNLFDEGDEDYTIEMPPRIYHFLRDSNIPNWILDSPLVGAFKSVDISEDGKYIVAGQVNSDDNNSGSSFVVDDKGNLIEYKMVDEEVTGVSIGKNTNNAQDEYFYASLSGEESSNESLVHIYKYMESNMAEREKIGLDMLNDSNPPITMTGYRNKSVTPLKAIQSLLKKNTSNTTDIKNTRLTVRDNGNKSNICFVEEQDITSDTIRFSFNDGIEKISWKKRPSPNFYRTSVNNNSVTYQHNTLPTGIVMGKLKGNFDFPDEAREEAFLDATHKEDKAEIKITVNKGHYLEIGNVISLYTPEHPELIGKHRIVSKSVSAGKAVKCQLGLNKEAPQVSDYISSS